VERGRVDSPSLHEELLSWEFMRVVLWPPHPCHSGDYFSFRPSACYNQHGLYQFVSHRDVPGRHVEPKSNITTFFLMRKLRLGAVTRLAQLLVILELKLAPIDWPY
jgi:hypothetical protein